MVQEFKRNNIYHMRIDFLGNGINNILFKVYDVKNNQGEKPQVVGRVALACNTDSMPDDIYFLANHVVLNDILLYYLGFELSNPIYELNANEHYVKYGILRDAPVAIKLVPEEDGGFSFVRLKEEDILHEKTCKIHYLDELQDLIRAYYKTELPIGLEKMNHACLNGHLIPELAMFIEGRVSQQGRLSIDQIIKILIQEKKLLDYDVEVVIKYGLAHGLFKLQPQSYGLIIEKA